MKYSELDKMAEDCGLKEIGKFAPWFHYVNKYDSGCMIKIYRNGLEGIAINNFRPSSREQVEFLKACIELAQTPLEEREEEKKYLLKHKYMDKKHYLVLYDDLDRQSVDVLYEPWNRGNLNFYKYYFTKDEIEEMKENFNTNFDSYEFIREDDLEREYEELLPKDYETVED